MRIASLSMYDVPEVRASTDAWWEGLACAFRRAGLRDVPSGGLERARNGEEVLRDPAFWFGQTCGYPLTHAFAGQIRVVATPCYTAPGCIDASYRSFIVVPRTSRASSIEDLRGGVCAVNERTSHSGMNVLRAWVAEHARTEMFFRSVVVTGSHRASIEHVASGNADVASIDCVTYALLARAGFASIAGTRIFAESEAAPCLPYVTCAETSEEDVQRMRDALTHAFADPALAPARDALLLGGFRVLPDNAYDRILEIERHAEAHGFSLFHPDTRAS